MVYWMLPRTMDETLTSQTVEVFKFISLPFLAGVSVRDSWKKLSSVGKNSIYIGSPVQLCKNYHLIEQVTLGWAFLTTAIGLVVYLGYNFFNDPSAYE